MVTLQGPFQSSHCETFAAFSRSGAFMLGIAFIIFVLVSTILSVKLAKSTVSEMKRVLVPLLFSSILAAMSYFAAYSGQGWGISGNCRAFSEIFFVDRAISFALITTCFGLIARADSVSIYGSSGAAGTALLLLLSISYLACARP